MKKIIASILSFFLLIGFGHVPAFAVSAADGEEATDVPVADEPGTVSWENLKDRITTGNINTQAIAESTESLNAIDYEVMRKELVNQLNALSSLQWAVSMNGGTTTYESALYDSLEETYKDLKSGKLQKDDADAKRQLENAATQVLRAGEMLYIEILSLEQSADNISCELSALDRKIQEGQLRLSMGMVSEFDLQTLETSRGAVQSQMQSVEKTITTCKTQLQALLGQRPTGDITLGDVSDFDEQWLDAREFEADLLEAKQRSWSLRSAEKDLEKAEEDFAEVKEKNFAQSYKYKAAEHAWNAAQLTHQSAVQDFEVALRAACDEVSDKQQVMESKQASADYHAVQLKNLQLKYDLGMISKSALYDAQDQFAAQQREAAVAEYDFYVSYRAYYWAIEYGILP